MLLKFIYNFLIQSVPLVLKLIALFNHKIKLGDKGRAQTFKMLKNQIDYTNQTIWFHCASLGEYEQGLPVFKSIKQHYPNHKVILTFFSPSGFENKKNSPIADVIVYLPIDTPANAKRFIQLVKPQLTVFVKYDIWPNYLNQLKQIGGEALLISALFRPKHRFFKWYGKWMIPSLKTFKHIFVQDKQSKQLLEGIKLFNVTLSGDTRFDRVASQLTMDNTLAFIEQFINQKPCVVAGSTWEADEALFINYINNCKTDTKFIIAPHNVNQGQIKKLKSQLTASSILFSEHTQHQQPLQDYKVFIVDTIGLLSKLYHYADIAYIGGAMGGTGLHNTLEAAVFGVPIIIGDKFKKFPEAIQMQQQGGLFSVGNQTQFNLILDTLISNPTAQQTAGQVNANYVKQKRGAVNTIEAYIKKTVIL